MSLFKQLWLAIFVLIAYCLIGSFILTTLSAKSYLETQLYHKNVDAANSIALTLAGSSFDEVFAELQIASQFDSGFYEYIRLTNSKGQVLIDKNDSSALTVVPKWFSNIIVIAPPEGRAQVSSGWRQIGTLSLMSSTNFAYQELWKNTTVLALYFLFTALASALAGHYLLLRLTQPLKAVVQQAKAIGERRFVTIEEPKTFEFRQLVKSMNQLSQRVKVMLVQDAERLQERHGEQTRDSITHLLTRGALLQQFHGLVRRDDQSASGCVTLFRINDLQQLNDLYGRTKLDDLIRSIGSTLRGFSEEQKESIVGRLDGGDFIVLLPGLSGCEKLVDPLYKKLLEVITEVKIPDDILVGCCSNYLPREDLENIFSRLNVGITVQSSDDKKVKYLYFSSYNLPTEADPWNDILSDAFTDDKFQLNLFPVVNGKNELLHLEAPIRLQYEDKLLSAGQFLGWAQRLNLMPQIDEKGLDLAFQWLSRQKSDIGINVSPYLLASIDAQSNFFSKLRKNTALAERLWIEIPESGVYLYVDEYKKFASQLKQLGCHLGIEHAGHLFEKIGSLHDVGLDYVKIDAAFIRDVDTNNANQVFLQGLVTIAHSIGLKIIAEGVVTDRENKTLLDLGFDGMTGPAIAFED